MDFPASAVHTHCVYVRHTVCSIFIHMPAYAFYLFDVQAFHSTGCKGVDALRDGGQDLLFRLGRDVTLYL